MPAVWSTFCHCFHTVDQAAALDGDLLVVSTIDDTVFISQGLFQVFVRGGLYGQFEWIGSFQPPVRW